MLVPWPWRRTGGHSPRTLRHPLPAEDLALKGGGGGKGRQFLNLLRFPGKEPRASILQENGGGRGLFRGRKGTARTIKGRWQSRESKHWSFTQNETPLREDQEQKNAGHSSNFFQKMKVKAKEAAGSARHPFWMSTVGGKPGERPAGRLQPEQGRQRGQRTKGASVCTQDPPPEAPARRAPPKDDLFPFLQ